LRNQNTHTPRWLAYCSSEFSAPFRNVRVSWVRLLTVVFEIEFFWLLDGPTYPAPLILKKNLVKLWGLFLALLQRQFSPRGLSQMYANVYGAGLRNQSHCSFFLLAAG